MIYKTRKFIAVVTNLAIGFYPGHWVKEEKHKMIQLMENNNDKRH